MNRHEYGLTVRGLVTCKPQPRLDCIGVSHLLQTQTQAGTQAQADRAKRIIAIRSASGKNDLHRKFSPSLGGGVEYDLQTQAGTQAGTVVDISKNFKRRRKRRFLSPLSSPFHASGVLKRLMKGDREWFALSRKAVGDYAEG